MASQILNGSAPIRVRVRNDSFASDSKNLGIRRAQEFIRRADDLLIDAAGSPDPSERFVYSYLAALRGAGAVLAVCEPATRRSRVRSAWVRMAAVSHEFEPWATYFAQHSVTRSAVEAGVSSRVDEALSNQLYLKAGEFLDAVDDVVEQIIAGGSAHGDKGKRNRKSA